MCLCVCIYIFFCHTWQSSFFLFWAFSIFFVCNMSLRIKCLRAKDNRVIYIFPRFVDTRREYLFVHFMSIFYFSFLQHPILRTAEIRIHRRLIVLFFSSFFSSFFTFLLDLEPFVFRHRFKHFLFSLSTCTYQNANKNTWKARLIC